MLRIIDILLRVDKDLFFYERCDLNETLKSIEPYLTRGAAIYLSYKECNCDHLLRKSSYIVNGVKVHC